MHPLIEKYGKQTISELLDIFIIGKQLNSADWRMFLIRHGIIKQTTKIIRPYARAYDSYYTCQHRNGRGDYVFSVKINKSEMSQLLEEIQST